MRKIALGLIATFAVLQSSIAAEWLTDLAKAKDQAKAEQKLVLVSFTGSDW